MVASARIGIYVNRIPYANPPSPTRYLLMHYTARRERRRTHRSGNRQTGGDSNLATAWMCLRLCGDHEPRPQWGHLMTLPLA
ncbi:hypothetical protein [Paraburkholderia rhizosphaerae]|uniref:Uncharacterized protein n=1 Tax=Paraburkholderia rhizosphaerae TaxID=480658 RepID=A0A4R8LIF8_9BURK|nr:hypothetical protein [Paraburkholderia rhizosphaerae]TDY42198.1 hypothetical protein BX592_1227 [Paraburkholderia rhizosphaerae]